MEAKKCMRKEMEPPNARIGTVKVLPKVTKVLPNFQDKTTCILTTLLDDVNL
jgi:hypothetical protein